MVTRLKQLEEGARSRSKEGLRVEGASWKGWWVYGEGRETEGEEGQRGRQGRRQPRLGERKGKR